MAVLFEKTKLLTDKQFHYCPGCNHGIIHRLVAEVIDEMQLDGKVIGVAPVGCSVFAYDYFNCDMYEAAHGRAPAVATGIKRAVGKDTMVFTYQGDGDLASIGTAEIVHAAHRGEKIVTIFVNNAIYGMTGGQMAPTTLIGQKATTCPNGRSEEWSGLPIKMSEMLCVLYLYSFPDEDTAHAIAQYSQLSAGMVSKSLESLREAGYICSQKDEQDNRIYHLHLTEKAQELVKRLRVAQSYFISEVAQGISGEEFRQVAEVAERMLENLAEHPQLGEGARSKEE